MRMFQAVRQGAQVAVHLSPDMKGPVGGGGCGGVSGWLPAAGNAPASPQCAEPCGFEAEQTRHRPQAGRAKLIRLWSLSGCSRTIIRQNSPEPEINRLRAVLLNRSLAPLPESSSSALSSFSFDCSLFFSSSASPISPTSSFSSFFLSSSPSALTLTRFPCLPTGHSLAPSPFRRRATLLCRLPA